MRILYPIFILLLILSAHEVKHAKILRQIPLAHPEYIEYVKLYLGGKLITIKGNEYFKVNSKVYKNIHKVDQFIHNTDGSFYAFLYEDYNSGKQKYEYFLQTSKERNGPYHKIEKLIASEDANMIAFQYSKESYLNWPYNYVYRPGRHTIEFMLCLPRYMVGGFVYGMEHDPCNYPGKDYSYYTQINNTKYGPHPAWTTSPESVIIKKKNSYAFIDGSEVRINDKVFKNRIYADNLVLSEDGKHFAFTYKSKGKYMLQVDDKTYGPYNATWIKPPVYTKNYQSFAFFYGFENKSTHRYNGYIAYKDHVVGPILLDSLSNEIVFNNDLSKFAIDAYFYSRPEQIVYEKGVGYSLKKGKQKDGHYIITEKSIKGPYYTIEGMHFIEDNSKLTYTYRSSHHSGYFEYIDRERHGRDKKSNGNQIKSSKDTAHSNNKKNAAPDEIVIDGKKYKTIAFAFTPDGKTIIAYVKEAMLIIEEL